MDLRDFKQTEHYRRMRERRAAQNAVRGAGIMLAVVIIIAAFVF